MMKKVIVFCVYICLLFSAVFVLRKRDLIIHVVAETSAPTSLIRLQMDDEILFEGKVSSGVYFGEKVTVENLDIGFHSLKILAVNESITYQKDRFFLFNRTIIITYFSEPSSKKEPYFEMWSKFGGFLPD